MAEEVVVKEALTDNMIEAGADLLRRLDKKPMAVDACLWSYRSESNAWRLMLASPDVSKYGPQKVYREIGNFLRSIPERLQKIFLFNISVVKNNDPLISVLRSATNNRDGVSSVRFTRVAFEGRYIDDVYIYRLTRPSE